MASVPTFRWHGPCVDGQGYATRFGPLLNHDFANRKGNGTVVAIHHERFPPAARAVDIVLRGFAIKFADSRQKGTLANQRLDSGACSPTGGRDGNEPKITYANRYRPFSFLLSHFSLQNAGTSLHVSVASRTRRFTSH